MITIEIKNNALAYDVQSLTKSFFPEESILVKERAEDRKAGRILELSLEEDSAKILFWQDGELLLQKERTHIFDEEKDWIRSEDSLKEAKRKRYKNQLKILVYEVLAKLSGRSLPWGTLTGVRPTKIPMGYYISGDTKEEIKEYMKKHYLCRDDKIDLSLSIAEKELSILEEIDYKNSYSIYIGIPFCPTTCLYCSFTSFSYKKYEAYAEPYLNALMKEIDYAVHCIPNKKLNTIYIGGGTPTTLSESLLERLLKKIRSSFPMEQVKEFTVEAGRPDSITKRKLEIMKEQGVTRISINPQTMNEETLKRIGRSHTISDIKEAFLLARETGHDNINMDLIVGLPGETLQDVDNTLEEIGKMNPDSMTIHSLVTKRAAKLNLEKEKKQDEHIDEMVELGYNFCINHGYQPYYMYRQKNTTGSSKSANQENIGYARPNKEGIYNMLIMEEKETILALGAGASSKFVFLDEDRVERVENVKSLTDYISRIDEMLDRKKSFLENNPL